MSENFLGNHKKTRDITGEHEKVYIISRGEKAPCGLFPVPAPKSATEWAIRGER
jgi:hypothetical protein